jgi:hypothetical protein
MGNHDGDGMKCRWLLLGLMLGSGTVAQAQNNNAVSRSFDIQPFGRRMHVSLDTVDTPTHFSGSPFKVYRALTSVYESLKIPLNITDSIRGHIGNSGVPLRNIDGKRMSAFLGCGSGMTGQYADIHRVTVAVVSWVQPRGRDSSTVRTGVFAGAVDRAEGSSSLPRPCSTTGMLEERIRTLLREKLAAGQ